MWSPQQQSALDRVGRWITEKNRPVFQLAGYAGTGKTTLAKYLAESVTGRVYFAAFTGKAAYVLRKKGVPNASTIHKLIYMPKSKSQARLLDLQNERARLLTHKPVPETLIAKVNAAIEAEQNNLARPMFQLNMESELNNAALVVVDEYSMIDEQMGKDLLSFGCPVLALGDPAQLPPVKGNAFFNNRPDLLLTEIHRQAADNPIIWLSKEVREGRDLKPGRYGESTVVRYSEAKPTLAEKVLSTDQLLVGRNATRSSSNIRTRQLLNHEGPMPVANDKLVCLRNNHELGLLNGQIWTSTEPAKSADPYITLEIVDEDGAQLTVDAHPDYFHGGKPSYWEKGKAEEFDYGYALTVHKAQGSQWDNVLLLDEWYMRERKEWLYTAITRAAERIDIIQM